MTIVIACLLLAALLGGYLALAILWKDSWRIARRGAFQWAHGLIGAAGLCALLFVPVPAAALTKMGLNGFRSGALIFLGLALLLGLIIVAASRKGRRPAGFMLGTHITIAIFGISLVLAIGLLA